MLRTRASIAMAGVGVLCALTYWVVGARADRLAQEEVVHLFGKVSATTTPDTLRQMTAESDHLTYVPLDSTGVAYVMTPLRFRADNWVLKVQFSSGRAVGAGMRVYDNVYYPSGPKDAPPDRSF